MNEVLKSLGDNHTLQIFELIAESRLRTWEIMDITKLSAKQAYGRIQGLTRSRLVKREKGVYRLTTHGMITLELLKLHKRAAEQTYQLIAVDVLLSDSSNQASKQEIINDLISDRELRWLIR